MNQKTVVKKFARKYESYERVGAAKVTHAVPMHGFVAICGAHPGHRYLGWKNVAGDLPTCAVCRIIVEKRNNANKAETIQGGAT